MVLLAGCLSAVSDPASAAALRFCAPAELPPMFFDEGAEGIQIAVASRLAERLGREARFVSISPGGSELEQSFSESRCDIMPGALASAGTLAGPLMDDALLTRPYYAAGYRLIRRADSEPAATLSATVPQRLAIEGESVVAYTLRQQGYPVQIMYDADSIIGAVASGEVVYGYLWGPVAAWKLREREDVIIASEFSPVARWDFAMALAPGEEQLLEDLNEALEQFISDGTMAEIFARYSLPYLAPESSMRD